MTTRYEFPLSDVQAAAMTPDRIDELSTYLAGLTPPIPVEGIEFRNRPTVSLVVHSTNDIDPRTAIDAWTPTATKAQQIGGSITVLRQFQQAIDAGQTPTAAQRDRAISELINVAKWLAGRIGVS